MTVKTPQYIIFFLLHPIIRNTFSKKDSLPGCPFYFSAADIFCGGQRACEQASKGRIKVEIMTKSV
jgi:hypothetical protein